MAEKKDNDPKVVAVQQVDAVDSHEISEEAEKVLEMHERRSSQGLDYFPFQNGLESFYKLGPEQEYTKNVSNALPSTPTALR